MTTVQRIEFYLDKAGEWRWQLRAENAEMIGASTEGYKNRADCIHNFESIHGKLTV